jgi:hypothetical protein
MRTILGRIRTPFNRRERTEKRVLINGRWVRPDPQAAALLAWFRDTARNGESRRLAHTCD